MGDGEITIFCYAVVIAENQGDQKKVINFNNLLKGFNMTT